MSSGGLLLVLQLAVNGGVTAPAPARCGVDAGPDAAPPPCELQVLRISEAEAPVLDGRLDEEVWGRAQAATGFVQQQPTPDAPSSQQTVARVLVARDAVYVGMRLHDDRPDSIRAQFVRRDDFEAVSDWAHVMLDTYYDRRTAFEFATTPTGARVDVLRLDDVETDPAWDAVWDVATSVDAEGWVAEFRIPLSQLRFSSDSDLRWGVNFARKIARRSEVSYWAPISPTAGREVSLYGDLRGRVELEAPGGVELLPYSVGRLTREPGDPADPFHRENETWGSVGLDLKYRITSNLILTGTINPDFGQVEADPSQVNLSAFETFYAEKRPFFTEGTEIFDFRLRPEGYAFYSRRIGRPPQLRAALPADGFSDARETAPILGAAKVSGKTGSGWSVGLMSAVTGKVDASTWTPEGEGRQTVEPLTTYSVARVSRDFREGRSGLGALLTAANRRLDQEELERLRSASYTGGVDGWHRFGPGAHVELSGWFLGTHARGSADAIARTQRSAAHLFTRPDADHLTYDPELTSLNGWAGEVELAKEGGSWTWLLGAGARSPGVELNDLGFLSYADVWYASAQARFSDFTPGRYLRNWYAEGEVVQAYTFGQESIRRSAHLRTRVTLPSFWQITLNTDRWASHFWPWELRGGPALRRSGYTNARWIVRSDSRKSWSASVQGTLRLDDQGGARVVGFDPKVDFRPTARTTVSLGPNLRLNRDADQYVARVAGAEGDSYVVGRVDQTTLGLEARVSYGFSPTLTLDVYTQPFLSTGDYEDFRTVADAGAGDFDVRLPLIPGLQRDPEANEYVSPAYRFRDPDFNVREFRLNAVLRWEYRPGSTLFLVWTQAREDGATVGDFDLGRDLDRLFAAPATNVFLVKLNYWIGL